VLYITNTEHLVELIIEGQEITLIDPRTYKLANTTLQRVNVRNNKLTDPTPLVGMGEWCSKVYSLIMDNNPFTTFPARTALNLPRLPNATQERDPYNLHSSSSWWPAFGFCFSDGCLWQEINLQAIDDADNDENPTKGMKFYYRTGFVGELNILNLPSTLTEMNIYKEGSNKLLEITAIAPSTFGSTSTERSRWTDLYIQVGLKSIAVDLFTGLTNLKTLYIARTELTALPASLFDTNTKLETLYLQNNVLSSISANQFEKNVLLEYLSLDNNALTSVAPEQFSTLVNVLEIRLSSNNIGPSLPKKLLEKNTKLHTLFVDGNNLSVLLPSNFFANNKQLVYLFLSNNPFSSVSVCPTTDYRSLVSLPNIASGTDTFYACDPCTRPSNLAVGLAHTCWQFNHDDYTSHHTPTACPRGSYCDPVSFTEMLCPAGTADFNIGNSKLEDCLPCEIGRFSPIPGSSYCPFTCRSGKWTDKVGAVDDSICLAADSNAPMGASKNGIALSTSSPTTSNDTPKSLSARIESLETKNNSLSTTINVLLVLLILVILVLIGGIAWVWWKTKGVEGRGSGTKMMMSSDPFADTNPGMVGDIELNENPMGHHTQHQRTSSNFDNPLTVPMLERNVKDLLERMERLEEKEE